MSISDISSSVAAIGASVGIAQLNPATIPQDVRTGNAAAKQAYTEGLAFEQVLVNQLTQQLSSSMSDASSSSDGSDSSTSPGAGSADSSGLLSGAASGYASMIPQALTSSIMSDGGLGLAQEFAKSIDPSLGAPGATEA